MYDQTETFEHNSTNLVKLSGDDDSVRLELYLTASTKSGTYPQRRQSDPATCGNI